MDLVLQVVGSVVGAVVAAHLATTAVVRWSRDQVVRRPARPRCLATTSHDLAWREVVPIVSWLRFRGRCPRCEEPIPWWVPTVEVVTMVVVVAATWLHGWPSALVVTPVAWSAVVATPIDLARRIIPNRLTMPLAAWTLVAVTVAAAVTGRWGHWRLGLLVGVVVPVGLLAISLAFEFLRGSPGMGMGDVKWAVALGLCTGWLGLPAVLAWLYGTVAASALGIGGMLVTGRARLAQRVPYGPYLAVGILVAVLGWPLLS